MRSLSWDELDQAQAPRLPDGTDDLWIDFQPLPSSLFESSAPPPSGAAKPTASNFRRDDDDTTTASAVSFAFIAIAVLVSMFLVIAIFERILRPRRSLGQLHHPHDLDVEFSQMSQRPLQWGSSGIVASTTIGKSPTTSYGKGVSVLMPGHVFPTFIAHPAPIVAETKAATGTEV
ncbi:uncharacterized protein LOC112346533 [Selaginella moellendorffii]|uniref:uncharacterized protein LOC112346533 n=1 Tax=Selaginella moellendorffii TaxID=88036 RepID=UPI000D1C4584|nr:uncharacterized protein LOC112346533 [Selaginella moellendorffii]|eukprot:XP_024531465.1 uncharacterized protein LOC112346533 [Selaginella moellendorffii]